MHSESFINVTLELNRPSCAPGRTASCELAAPGDSGILWGTSQAVPHGTRSDRDRPSGAVHRSRSRCHLRYLPFRHRPPSWRRKEGRKSFNFIMHASYYLSVLSIYCSYLAFHNIGCLWNDRHRKEHFFSLLPQQDFLTHALAFTPPSHLTVAPLSLHSHSIIKLL